MIICSQGGRVMDAATGMVARLTRFLCQAHWNESSSFSLSFMIKCPCLLKGCTTMTRMHGSALKSSSLVCSRANLRRCRWPGNSDHLEFPSDAGDRQEDGEEQELPVENKQSLLPEPERDLGQVGRGGEVGGGERWAPKRKEKMKNLLHISSETAPPWRGEASPVRGEGRPTAGECCKVTFK